MPDGRHETGPVPVSQVNGAGQPVRTTDGPIRTGGGRLDALDELLGDVLDSVSTDHTGEGARPLTPREMAQQYEIAPVPHPRGVTPRGRRAAPGAGSAIVARMLAAEGQDGSSEGGQTD